MFDTLSRAVSRRLAAFLTKSLPDYRRLDTVPIEQVAAVLQTGDIVLVEGNSRISVAIKYLTQSSWSHAALYVGDPGDPATVPNLIEADVNDGVRSISLDHYKDFNLRICRAASLNEADKHQLLEFMRSKLGDKYDMKNVFDLMRYLIQKPAVPTRYRRAMIGFGSGEPTQAICSTLIAEAFQRISYPILPVRNGETQQEVGEGGEVPSFYRRHFTHFTPRDFDLSPYFSVIKPTIIAGFDHRRLHWSDVQQVLEAAPK